MIGVYGATGMLGRRVTARFDRVGMPTILISRSQTSLSRLTTPGAPRATAVARVDDAAAIERALDGCHVLVNCVPATVSGDLLVRAALDAGIHYVDAAAEQHHIRHVFEKYDEEATQCDVAIVPGLGFDYAIGDCLASLAAHSHQPADHVVVAYAIEGADVSRKNAQAAATTAGPEVVFREGVWRPVPFEFDRGWFDFPDPIGPRQMSRYGSGEVITVPRHVKTKSVRTLITSSSLCPYPSLLAVFPVIRPLVGFVRRTPARAIFGLISGVLGRSRARDSSASPEAESTAPTRSPAQDDRRFIVAAEVHALSGSVGRAIAAGGNSHEVTAAILAQGALWLAEGSVVAGVRSAATAFEPHVLLDSLAPEGVSWSQLSSGRA